MSSDRNTGCKRQRVFVLLLGLSAAPNTSPPGQTIGDLGAVRQDVHVIYISYGALDGLMSNGKAYHDYFVTNNVPHVWQIEASLGHERVTWNRSLYNFAQLIFR